MTTTKSSDGTKVPFLRRFRRSEEGNGTIEFVLFVPFFLALFLSSFELGMLLARNVMLDRGLDIAVRQVRLGQMDPVNHDNMKAAVCDAAVIIPDAPSKPAELEQHPRRRRLRRRRRTQHPGASVRSRSAKPADDHPGLFAF